MELLRFGSYERVPFRLVLHKLKMVDYRSIGTVLQNKHFKEISEALSGNVVLKHLCFGTHQV